MTCPVLDLSFHFPQFILFFSIDSSLVSLGRGCGGKSNGSLALYDAYLRELCLPLLRIAVNKDYQLVLVDYDTAIPTETSVKHAHNHDSGIKIYHGIYNSIHQRFFLFCTSNLRCSVTR
jgi:hypothetical protein